jgi:hypothetical protein
MRKIWQFSLLIGLEILLFSLPHILVRGVSTSDALASACSQLRRLSPLSALIPDLLSAIRSFWHNVTPALARVKNAPGRAHNSLRHRSWGVTSNLLTYSSKRLKSACVGRKQWWLLPNTHAKHSCS